MADGGQTELATAPTPRRGRVWRWLGGTFAALLLLLIGAGLLLDSGAGRRFLADQIATLSPDSGLKIRIGRIEGSIYGNAVLRDVRLSDPEGEFLRVAEARLDWQPFDFVFRNRLSIDSLVIPRATLARLPELRETDPDAPILPDFDILLDDLRVERLTLGRAISGETRVATVRGRADIRTGTADIDLDARLIDGGDRITLDLVASPDRGAFDIDADLVAPKGGVIAALAGLDSGVTGIVRGSGNWQNWQGALIADAGGGALARLRLTARDGLYGMTGRVRPGLVLDGLIDRLAPQGIAIDASGRFEGRRWDGRFDAVGEGLQIGTTGALDLANNRFSGFRVDAWLRRPAALLDGMDGQNVRFAARLDGGFAEPRFEYRLSAPWLSFGNTRLSGIEARGDGIAGGAIARLPLRLTVERITGLGEFADGIVRNLRAEGLLQWQDGALTSDLIRLRSDGLDGRVALTADFGTGDYLVGFDGALPGLEVGGLGRVDLVTDIEARRRADGNVAITGTARAAMQRFDNGFLRTLAGGLPTLTTTLVIGSDGVLRFTNIRLDAPLLTLAGEGERRTDGTFRFTARGEHGDYGPVTLILDGPIGRPHVDLRFASPLPAAGLADVDLQLRPDASSFAFSARGGSTLGLFEAEGRILLPPGGSAVLDIARLSVGGTVARGRLAVVAGGLAGRLSIAGGGLDGDVALSMANGVQRIALALTARDANFAGPPPIAIRRGQLRATILLDPAGTDIDATFEGSGIRRGTLTIARIAGTARVTDGRGTVRGTMAGTRGRGFELAFAAAIAPDRYRIGASGTLARQPIRLVREAVIRREEDGWRLDPAELAFAGGRVRLSGEFGSGVTVFDVGLDGLPLSLLDIVDPTLGLGGRASGTLSYRDAAGLPTGRAQLRLRDFSRVGLTDSGGSLDIALNGALEPGSAALRAVIGQGGRTIGRVQGRVTPLGGGDDLIARVVNAPLTANLRYNGEAGTLWRLTGIETLALSGPVAVSADAGGTLADPRIRGSLRANGVRFESFQTGTVVTNASAVGRFDGARLQLRNIAGETPGGGRVTGEGDFDLSAADGFGMDLRLLATNALLLARDDITARVTGPARLFSTGNGGVISGNFTIDQGRFRLGRATSAEALPVINVVELNVPGDRAPPVASAATRWRIDVRARARNNFTVTGLGLESEWSADVAVTGPLDTFGIAGTARLVRGDYNFAGRRFELESGTIRFTGATIDPVLDIVAVDDIAGIDAQIRVRGTGLRPEITFASTPALPEDELLSRILFGSSITDISVTEAAQLGIALASLRSGGDGLDPINAIRRATGLDRLRILPANTEIGSGTSVAAGKYITRRVFVEIITDGQGYSATRAEYQVTRWLAILAAISTLNDESINVRVKRDY